MGRVGGLELVHGLVELARLEKKVGQLDLGFGEGGIERDNLAKEGGGLLLVRVGGAVGQQHRLSVKRIGLASVLGHRIELSLH